MIVSKVEEEHKKLAQLQQRLSVSLDKFTSPSSSLDSLSILSPRTATSSSSGKAKSVSENWNTTNFALGTLLIINKKGEIISLDIAPTPFINNEEFARIIKKQDK